MTTDWVPGDPLMPDNGCGGRANIELTEEERARVRAEDGLVPPWFRPGNLPSVFPNGHCRSCEVRWQGDAVCWMCGGAA